MDSSPAADSPDVYMTIDELVDEIQYQKTLLLSIDDTVEDRHEAEAQVKAEIRRLDRQLQAMKGETTSGLNQPKGSIFQNTDRSGPSLSNKGMSSSSFVAH
jgi:hypothetical protein